MKCHSDLNKFSKWVSHVVKTTKYKRHIHYWIIQIWIHIPKVSNLIQILIACFYTSDQIMNEKSAVFHFKSDSNLTFFSVSNIQYMEKLSGRGTCIVHECQFLNACAEWTLVSIFWSTRVPKKLHEFINMKEMLASEFSQLNKFVTSNDRHNNIEINLHQIFVFYNKKVAFFKVSFNFK